MDDFEIHQMGDIEIICCIVLLLVASRTSCGFSSHRPLSESRTRVDGSLPRICFAKRQRSKTREEIGRERGYTGGP